MNGGHASNGQVTSSGPGALRILEKAPTGIRGFDEVTLGGLPRGRTTLVCGAAGCGKTLFAMEFIVRGVVDYGEPGVFVSFEESSDAIAQNVASLGFNIDDLVERGKLSLDHVRIERCEIEETGEYDLEGLFVRLAYAIDSVGAKRVVLDTLEALFAALGNETILRAELRRLFRWLDDRGVTAVITGERGNGTLTRRGLEEYVSDCVILLDQRVHERVATRHLRIVKYRGTTHGTNEYPFLIQENGISVLPVTSLGLEHPAPTERMSTGVPRLDTMLGGKGLYRGSSVLLSGTAGTGKTSLAAHVVHDACRRGEKALYFSFEESENQFVRNMRTIGVDLQPAIDAGLLRYHASRPTLFGLEMHLATIHREIETFRPEVVIIDPLTNFTAVGSQFEVGTMLMRLVDFLKSRQITSVFTSLTPGGDELEQTEVGVSSLMDAWLLVRHIESSGERNRGLYVLKARGMPHSNQVREFLISERGIELADVYVGSSGVLTGTARHVQEATERAELLAKKKESERKRRDMSRKRILLEAQIASLQAQFESEAEELDVSLDEHRQRESSIEDERDTRARLRHADNASASGLEINTKGGDS